MKILLVHNKYKHQGGEDKVFARENSLLACNGHQCFEFVEDNENIHGFLNKLMVGLNSIYSKKIRDKIDNIIKSKKPDIVHVHNFFPIISPSVFDACQLNGVPVVFTLHNFRIICPGALFMRSGAICTKCLNQTPYHAVSGKCYRDSLVESFAVARLVAYHRKHHTWGLRIDRFIALSGFSKNIFVEAGLPPSKISIKPNYYTKVKPNSNFRERGGALFVGRLSGEKGINTLINAWRGLAVPLTVAGCGPLLGVVTGAANPYISYLGQIDEDSVSFQMSSANFLVVTSECFENFPLTLAEAFAHGLPVIASRLGAMAEIVEDGVTGLHFESGNAEDLAAKVRWMNDHPDECRQMGYNARREFEAKYTPERNYEMLMKIYQEAIDEKKKSR